LDPFRAHLARAVQATLDDEFLLLGQMYQMVERKDGLDGLLVKGHPQEPEEGQGQ
jgi:hypothetical protein